MRMSSPLLIEEAIPPNPEDDATSLLLTAAQAAAMLGATARTWRTWHAAGRIPLPIRIGRKTYWRPNDLRAWVAAGCPDRETWAIMRE
jgi:prophage regulatory protein